MNCYKEQDGEIISKPIVVRLQDAEDKEDAEDAENEDGLAFVYLNKDKDAIQIRRVLSYSPATKTVCMIISKQNNPLHNQFFEYNFETKETKRFNAFSIDYISPLLISEDCKTFVDV